VSDLDYYKVLQVDPEADPDVITAAFRVLARKLHPDRDLTGVHEVRMAELNRAYSVLRDPAKRQEYDQTRARDRAVAVGPGHEKGREQGHGPDRWASRAEDSPDRITLDFGRYAGYTLRELAKLDPDYLRWLSRHSSGIRYRNAIAKVLAERPADPYGARPIR
jgi:curved DNA-binding protein CbpA